MSKIFSGILGNYSQSSLEELNNQYGCYLLSDEKIEFGFKLVRDCFLITSERLIFIDHQGVTGKKTRVASIGLDSIIDVTMETAGTGFDDSELTISYIKSPYYKSNNVELATYKFEFGKKFDVKPIYQTFMTLAHENLSRINS